MRVLLFAISFLITATSFAQKKESYFHIGISGNSYNGEIGNYNKWSPGFQGGVLFNQKERFNGALNFGLGSITGEDGNFGFQGNSSGPAPNNFVKTNFTFANYDLHFNILKKEGIIVYLSQGIGLVRFSPQDEFGKSLETQDNTRAENETYRNLTFIAPTQVGVIYFLSEKIGFSFQTGLQNVLTDYFDNISELGENGNDNTLALKLSLLVRTDSKIIEPPLAQ